MKVVHLDKQYILDRVSQVDIFERFLHIKVDLDSKYRSPFRNEKDPSCSFRYSKDKLKFKDFGGTRNLDCDCFELVGLLHGINCNTKQGFMLILNIIAKTFNLIEGTYLEKKIERQEVVTVKKQIIPVIKEFTSLDEIYWKRGNVTIKKLKENGVRKCNFIFIDNELIYIDSNSNPAYLYIFTQKDYRIYFPLSKSNKFITTSSCNQGLQFLTGKLPFVIINKSYKDVLSITSFFLQGSNIESFALGNEKMVLSEEGYKYLTETLKYKLIFTLTDYDPAGLHCAWIHRKKYNTIPLYIKNKTWNSGIKYDIKDFWDLAVFLKTEETQKYIDKIYDKFKDKIQYEENR